VTSSLERACIAWETAQLVEPTAPRVQCRTGISLPGASNGTRFCYVGVASPIEQVLGDQDAPAEKRGLVSDREGSPISVAELASRLLDGEVASVLAPPRPVSIDASAGIDLPFSLLDRRAQIRHQNVLIRFVLRQIGLEEVSAHRGARPELYERAASLWSLDLALCTDPAMLLTLGADRQRYVDSSFNERALDRLPRALGRLSDAGVRSYPRLVIV